jgi:hypothetical protein
MITRSTPARVTDLSSSGNPLEERAVAAAARQHRESSMGSYSMKRSFNCHRIALTLACAWSGCGTTDHLDLGSNVDVTHVSLTDYSGTWRGYVEAYKFHDGSDRVQLELDSEGHGSLKFGETTLPAPTSDKGYPPGLTANAPWIPIQVVAAGFPYGVSGASVVDSRIRLSASSAQVYQEWCALMTPHQDTSQRFPPGDYYQCLPQASFQMLDGGCQLLFETGTQSIDCGLLSCQHRCACDANACHAREPTADLTLDGSLERNGDGLVGTLVLLEERVTVRLSRQ